jgi:regulator of cell morphogenesis and NO signaling
MSANFYFALNIFLKIPKVFMALRGVKRIDQNLLVSEIVNNDYRAADVFRRYGIDFCCGGKWPLKAVCDSRNLDIATIKKELEEAVRTIHLPNTLNFEQWDIDFLSDYIVNVHHEYLREALPEARDYLVNFMEGHQKKYPYLVDLLRIFTALCKEMIPHLEEEENIIFPYIRQIAHAYHSNESYAGLLVRTLRKPVENVMHHEHESVNRSLRQMRQLTDHYTPPEGACISHKVTLSKLLEIDDDLIQHIHLENDILFPRAIAMEKELLERKD